MWTTPFQGLSLGSSAGAESQQSRRCIHFSLHPDWLPCDQLPQLLLPRLLQNAHLNVSLLTKPPLQVAFCHGTGRTTNAVPQLAVLLTNFLE